MSMPFIDAEFTFTQPDGSPLQVRGTGNQHQARFETLDGFTVVRDPATGYYEYAAPADSGAGLLASGVTVGAADPGAVGFAPGLRASETVMRAEAQATSNLPTGNTRWEQRRRARRDAQRLFATQSMVAPAGMALPAPPQRHTVGRFVGLTLLIDFSDQPATIARDEVEAFCNEQGYSGFGNVGSVRDYFRDISDGKLEYSNIVAPYYRARQPRSYYTNESVEQPRRAWELIREALDHLAASGFDGSVLSADEQDHVYALNVFYAGKRVNNWAKGLWPHAYHLAEPYALAPGKNLYDYQITDMTAELSLGTFCHENGHMICDFPDLYDYGYQSSGAGKFCLMCSGGSGAAREKNPTQVGAYLKHAAGWTSSATTLAPGSVTLHAGRNDFAFHRKSDTEYFVIENRAASGRDAALDADGLAVWHVDEQGSNNHEQGTVNLHYECALIQADGLRELENRINDGDHRDLFRAGHNDSFGHMTRPESVWWNRSVSGLDILNISAAGPQMQFDVVEVE
ncbi:M6 family metalloprotease domain-containing protein [Sphingomonas sp. DG1-23]|uniref:M6 family metalloprotease domain-containing protein n=1 Tax=Sphingomonas sp. DG1-23 TaxID=3068316 RepID=UPI00273D2C29|nr:M6 family metalloprotease domain-containing protein [Sphingomonas sp. DG1-23]MDP5279185.1 M6 family metalloprotease domain-containing protein [Sphingomonas sp. DG1-23]